ncbi:lamin tail domain-containing protein [Conexibacter sp. CPCC 206217]|uniref:lamin tail domain-containing protein n=1 Tax=Conexibacter sp. CPCC 206217 TaxID=3064574 RepID=UPI00271D696B|nr:lamin tail domain-containing protein [Conexibacter sp. CPCC 206217]MDO8211626.1 lamin tail domain-containing protein [Conexibacter sp. CPCC 206217]
MSHRSLRWPSRAGVTPSSRSPRGHRARTRLPSQARRLASALLALVLLAVALTATSGTAFAAPTDPVTVPDASFKAVMNKAIASATSTTRTPEQTITEADAETVTTLDDQDYDAPTISDFTGAEALKNVTSFSLARPSGSASSLQPFAGLTRLTQLTIVGSEISDLGPLGGLASLTSLILPVGRLTTLQGIEGLTNLTYVEFAANELTDVAALATLPNLSYVGLSTNRITDLSPLAGLTKLENVVADENRLTSIDFILNLKLLTSLSVYNNRISDVSVFEQIPTFAQSGHRIRSVNSSINLMGNRIRDLSALGIYPGSRQQDNGANIQAYEDIYVGPYQAGGITLDPKLLGFTTISGTKPSPNIGTPGTGTYSEDGQLTLTNPAAPFIELRSGTINWTVHFSEDPAKLADLKINEVESNGDAVNGDWLELYNPSSTAVDVSGLVLSDSDDTHKLTLPAGSSVPARGYAAFRTDDPAVTGNFGLGAADSVRVFAPGTTDLASATAIDSYSWTSHATTTYGRTAPGVGAWATTDHGTFAAENVFPLPVSIPTVTVSGDAASTDGRPSLTATVRKPGGSDVATDATGTVVFSVDGQAVSGPVTVSNGVARWTPSAALTGSPSGTAHAVTARYVSAGDSDPYDDSAGASDPFTVTVTILEFGNATIELSTQTPHMCQSVQTTISGWGATAPDTITYQWQIQSRDTLQWSMAPGAGKTQAAFTPSYESYDQPLRALRGDFGTYRLQATGVKAGYAPKIVIGPTVTVNAQTQFTATPAATLDVTAPKVGQRVTATHPAWSSCLPSNYDGVKYDYQWLRDGQPIADATDTITGDPKQVSYTATVADAGHVLSLRVSVSAHQFLENTSVTSAETARVADGAFTAAPVPTLDNLSPKVGETLRASAGTWAPAAAFAYQWLRDGQPITGATDTTYTTVAADGGHVVSVKVTGSATGYVATAKESAATARVADGAFTTTPVPTLDNAAPRVGETLRASAGTWAPVASLEYQWLRDGQPIAGATSATYTVVAADVDHTISVQVTGRATGYATVVKVSTATGKVPALPVDPPKQDPPVENPPVVNPPVVNPPPAADGGGKKDDTPKASSVRPSIRVAAVKGAKVQVTVSVKGLAKSLISQRVTVKIAGIKGSFTVALKQGTATFKLPAKARTAKKARLTVSLTKFTKRAGGKTYLVRAATKTATVGVR